MTDAASRPYRFHAFDVSYFSAKVRTALRQKGVWYEEVRADLREIRERTGLGFVPIVVTPEGDTWQDSSEIFDRLEARHPDRPLFPRSPVQRLLAHLVELYVDEFGLLPAMHCRWGSPLAERMARARFVAMIGDERLGRAAADRMARARSSLGATDALAPAIEAHTRDLLDALSALFEGSPYLLGDRLSFGDCALMGPLYGHLFNDLVSRRLLLETAVPVVGWIERCQAPDGASQGDWSADEALPDGLLDVLAIMGRDAAPVILDGVHAFERWAQTRSPDLESIPRAVGTFESRLRDLPLERFTGAYALWMLQRTLDSLDDLSKADRARVDATLAGTGWEPLLAHAPGARLAKRGFELVFV